MGFSQENGYVPVGLATIVSSLRERVNAVYGTTYTVDQFVGTNFYKFYYALAQELHDNEVKTSEIFIKLQDYIESINARISRPVNTNPGIVEKLGVEGYVASVKPMIEADAGKINIAVDVEKFDDEDVELVTYPATKLALATLISQITVGGGVTQGDESQEIVLSNGQSFDFKYHLPNRIPVKLKLTIETSENNQTVILGPDVIKENLLKNLKDRYYLGLNFEPQKYWNIADDSPWAGEVKLEWSDNDEADDFATFKGDVFDANFDDLYTFKLEDITLVEV